ncbi:MAG: hypothetical protein IKX80_05585 [Lachnospiraceae bacterium]|nr:hypothetical protein [Lachnospiraceae bacterium]MBR5968676.1 hypothetical protein [Lachnospiraceae bacterium]
MELLKLNCFRRIYHVDCFPKEFSGAVSEAWKSVEPYERYQKKLLRDLAVLDDQGEQAIKLPQYEELSQTKYRMYSIRHPETKKNVRVIYVIEDGRIVLLTAFLEKNGSDYFNGIARAETRYDLLIE